MQRMIALTLAAAAGALLVWALIGIIQRRWKRVGVSSLLALGLCVRLFVFPQPWDVLDASQLKLLKRGMTQAEVEALLGGPPGCYGNPLMNSELMHCEGFVVNTPSTEVLWFDDLKQFELWFDNQQRLVAWHRRSGFGRSYLGPRRFFRDLTGY